MTAVQVKSPETGAAFLVACLCAQWCGSCRDYRVDFDAFAARFPDVQCAWVDVEDEPEIAGDIDIENFPTLVIQRGADVLFCGAMQPYINQLERLLQTFIDQTPEESQRYARANDERRAWQGLADVRSRLEEK